MKGNFLKVIKSIFKSPIGNVIINGQILKAFPGEAETSREHLPFY